MARASRSKTVGVIEVVHMELRTLASRLDLPGWLRMRLHRAADALLKLLLEREESA